MFRLVGIALLIAGALSAPFLCFIPCAVDEGLRFGNFSVALSVLFRASGGLLSFGHSAFLACLPISQGTVAKIWGFTPELGLLTLGAEAGAGLGFVFACLATRRQGITLR